MSSTSTLVDQEAVIVIVVIVPTLLQSGTHMSQKNPLKILKITCVHIQIIMSDHQYKDLNFFNKF